jgi:GNAT superfamily N-acetyltransferase
MRITIRTASLDDLGTIHAIRRDAIFGIPSETGLSDRQMWADRRSPEFFADRVAAGQVVIARAAGDDIGWGSHADAWITGLYVRPSWSRRRVGRGIMNRLERELVQRGHTCARLASSPNASGFYCKLGYAAVGIPDGEGAVPMKKCLSMAAPPSRAVSSDVKPLDERYTRASLLWATGAPRRSNLSNASLGRGALHRATRGRHRYRQAPPSLSAHVGADS